MNETIVRGYSYYNSDETVQLYIKDIEASATVPVWELKTFERISLVKDEEIKFFDQYKEYVNY